MVKKSISILNNTINYAEYGKGKNILLFFMGWLNDVDKMDTMLKNLPPKIKIIIPELPNFHKSSLSQTPLTLENYIEIIKLFIEELGLNNFNIGGHSAGGRFAISLAAILSNKIKKLILLAPAGYPHKPKYFSNRMHIQYSFSKFFISKDSAINILIPTYNNLFNSDVEKYINKVKAPTLLLWGEKDKVISKYHSKYYVKNIENIKYLSLEKEDHMLIKKDYVWDIISEFILYENPE